MGGSAGENVGVVAVRPHEARVRRALNRLAVKGILRVREEPSRVRVALREGSRAAERYWLAFPDCEWSEDQGMAKGVGYFQLLNHLNVDFTSACEAME